MMARAEKLIEADIQIEGFANNITGWLKVALSKGKAVKVLAVTDDEEDFDFEKSDIQRKKFHSMIADIQRMGVITIPGRKIIMRKYNLEQCKALLVMWFVNEINELNDPGIKIPNPPEYFDCPITGQTITIRPSTTKWGKKLTCVFVDFLYATGPLCKT